MLSKYLNPTSSLLYSRSTQARIQCCAYYSFVAHVVLTSPLRVLCSVYIGDETADQEPDFQYTPDTYHISTTLPPGGDPLGGSLSLLQEGLDSGAALAQFEVASQDQ